MLVCFWENMRGEIRAWKTYGCSYPKASIQG